MGSLSHPTPAHAAHQRSLSEASRSGAAGSRPAAGVQRDTGDVLGLRCSVSRSRPGFCCGACRSWFTKAIPGGLMSEHLWGKITTLTGSGKQSEDAWSPSPVTGRGSDGRSVSFWRRREALRGFYFPPINTNRGVIKAYGLIKSPPIYICDSSRLSQSSSILSARPGDISADSSSSCDSRELFLMGSLDFRL